MKTLSTCSSLLVLILSSIAASAQSETARVEKSSGATVTVSASGERVRFTAPESVVQIRLDIYSSSGKKVFDNEVRGGNVLDWHLQDGQAEPLADDSYLCVVTVKSLSGRITQRIGSVTVEKSSARVQPFDASQMSAQQSQAIGPVEENASLTVLKQDENQTTTVIAHNGEEGQITRGRGALSFRIGDFLSGKDIEQMRLTPEGNLGIGITHPEAKLDVDGLIRTSSGIMFPDGTVQTTAAIGSSTSQGGSGQFQTGRGSKPGKLNKGSGRTGKGKDTVSPEFTVNEDLIVNGNIIFTSGTLGRDITRQDNNGGIRIFANPTLTSSPATSAIQFFGNGHPSFPGQAYIDSGANDAAAVIFRTAGTGGTIAERMRITAAGSIGIGTTAPTQKLHVVGDGLVSGNIAAKYQDVAEWVPATEKLASGTVVSLDKTRSNTVTPSSRAYDTHVAGVVSAQPGVTLGERGEGKVLVATTGRVKVKVDATGHPIRIGDLLVTSTQPGMAMK